MIDSQLHLKKKFVEKRTRRSEKFMMMMMMMMMMVNQVITNFGLYLYATCTNKEYAEEEIELHTRRNKQRNCFGCCNNNPSPQSLSLL